MVAQVPEDKIRALRLDGKGRVTIPKDIRDAYQVNGGDRIDVAIVSVETDGYVCDECGRRYELPEVLVLNNGDRIVCANCTTVEDRIID